MTVKVREVRPLSSSVAAAIKIDAPPPRIQGGVVHRTQTPYYKERGWTRFLGKFKGDFVTKDGRWRGEATVSPGGQVEAYIYNPPQELEKHPHGICFMEQGRGKFFIHTSDNRHDLSSLILRVERILTESFEL